MAYGAPGWLMPATVPYSVKSFRTRAASRRSRARLRARRTRGSSNGFFSWWKAIVSTHVQGLFWITILSPSACFRLAWSRSGVAPTQSAATRPPRSAATRAAPSTMNSARKPSRYGNPFMK